MRSIAAVLMLLAMVGVALTDQSKEGFEPCANKRSNSDMRKDSIAERQKIRATAAEKRREAVEKEIAMNTKSNGMAPENHLYDDYYYDYYYYSSVFSTSAYYQTLYLYTAHLIRLCYVIRCGRLWYHTHNRCLLT
jgi:hypothetical protein